MTGVELQRTIWSRLAEWHEANGTPGDERVGQILVGSRVLELLAVDGMSQRAARAEIGLSRRRMAWHVGVLTEVFPAFEEWLGAHARRLRAGVVGAPQYREQRPSRRRLKAPQDGRWNDRLDSRVENDETAAA